MVAGIPIRLNFSLVIFIIWLAYLGYQKGSWLWPLLVLTLFFCVLLHELGHALTALKYGIRTNDITLYPIGGVAMLADKPEPRQEFWISLAGPLVNLVIAGLLSAVYIAQGGKLGLSGSASNQDFIRDVIGANITLALFNLIPAFPMDGGRVLRAVMAMYMPPARATHIAATIGQGLAIALGLAGLITSEVVLMLVAFFIFIAAGQEAQSSLAQSFLSGHIVEDAMQTRFRTIHHGATLDEAAQMLLAGSQHDFPVEAGDEIVGILTHQGIATGLATDGPTGYVVPFLNLEVQEVEPHMQLEGVLEMFGSSDGTPILVKNGALLVGMITSENLSEFIMIEAAKKRQAQHAR